MLGVGEVHPPGYFSFIYSWQILGTGEGVLRFPSVLFGLLSLFLGLHLFRQWGNEREATLAMGLLAVSTYHIEASRELRMYSLLVLLVLLALTCLQHWLQGGGPRYLVGYSLATALSFYTHYLSFFALPVAFFWVLPGGLARWWRWLLALAGSGFLFLPWLQVLLKQVGGQDLLIRPAPTWSEALELLGRMTMGNLGPSGSSWFMGAGLFTLSMLLAVGFRSRRDLSVQRAMLWVWVPLVVLFGLSTLTSMRLFEFKYFVWCTPPLVWLLAKAILSMPWRWLQGSMVILLVLGNLSTWWPTVGQGRDYGANWQAMANFLRANARPDDLILVHPSMNAVPLIYYGIPANRMLGVDQPSEEQLQQFRQAPRVFLVTTPVHPYVRTVGLESSLMKLMPRTEERELRPRLPSGWLRVVRFR